MNAAGKILMLMLCAVCSVNGDTTTKLGVVYVGGDVPKPGPVKFEKEGMTIDSAMEGVGMDLTPFYAKEKKDNDGLRCPIKVVVYHRDEKTIYDPSVDFAEMRKPTLELNDTIVVMDLRQHPVKIGARKKRVEKMLTLGSIEIMDELLSLATLQYEYEEWQGQAGVAAKGSAEYLKKEASRLIGEGKGQKILNILELKLDGHKLDGLGPSHPTNKETTSLIEIYRDLISEER